MRISFGENDEMLLGENHNIYEAILFIETVSKFLKFQKLEKEDVMRIKLYLSEINLSEINWKDKH